MYFLSYYVWIPSFTYIMKGFTFIVKGFTYIMKGFRHKWIYLEGIIYEGFILKGYYQKGYFKTATFSNRDPKVSALVPQESFLPTIKCWSPCGVENDMVGRKKGSCAEKKPLWHHHHLHLGIKRKASPVYFDRWWEKHHMKK